MAVLFLLIADTALREAVVEQIAAAKIGEIRIAENPAALLKLMESEKPDAILIEDKNADKKIAALLQSIGESTEKPPVLLLGGTDDTDHVSENFVKPFRLGHLLTRLRYHIETAPLLRDRIVTFGPYRLEGQNRRLLRVDSDAVIRLTEKETALLLFLAQSPEAATRRDILAAVWGYDERIDTRTLETHIYQLRRKLEGDGTADGENWLINEAGCYRLARGAA